jgi:hypothetical protein
MRGKIAVYFDGHYATDAGSEGLRQRASSGANLQEDIVRGRGDRVEEFRHPGRLEKMLAESFPGAGEGSHLWNAEFRMQDAGCRMQGQR